MRRSSVLSTYELVDTVKRGLERSIRGYPVDFFNSFAFTRTGRNLTHPLTVAELARVMWSVPYVRRIGIDVRFNNEKGIKFQPDLVAFDEAHRPLFYIDYESPNSSDARIPDKDIAAYRRWQSDNDAAPYLIVTTLPDHAAPDWELRYTAKGQCNEQCRGRLEAVRKNPFRFWVRYWGQHVHRENLKNITILNIDGKRVRRVRLRTSK